MKRSGRWLALLSLCLLLLVACGQTAREEAPTGAELPPESGAVSEPETAPTEEEAARVVRLVTHDSFNISEEVLAAFEEANDARVEIIQAGDAGAMVNQSILSANNPLGDVLYGIDNTFLTRALNADLFEPYESPRLDVVPDQFEVDAEEHRVTPIDYGDVCLNYDKAYFEEAAVSPPTTLQDLTQPDYRELTVVENPASSSPGLSFLLATVDTFGEDGWQSFWQALRDNGVLVTSGWEEAYFDHFTGGSPDGTRPIVVSYASSPAASEGQTASVLSDGSCFRQIEFAGLLRNAENPDLGRALIDFMLSEQFQADVPEQMFVFPVVEGVPLPDAFAQYAQVPDEPASVEPGFIEANRDALIEQWTEIVLR